MSKEVEVYLDPIAMGPGIKVSPVSSFLGREITMPEDVANTAADMMGRFFIIQGWLQQEYERASMRGRKVEVPAEVKEALWPEGRASEESKPKKKATARRSKKTSQTKRKKTASSSTTSPKEAS